jgi:hypothetical protein
MGGAKKTDEHRSEEWNRNIFYIRSKFTGFMNTLVYALRDFFEFTFSFMPSIGAATNLIFISLISFFTVYWIREMIKNPDQPR